MLGSETSKTTKSIQKGSEKLTKCTKTKLQKTTQTTISVAWPMPGRCLADALAMLRAPMLGSESSNHKQIQQGPEKLTHGIEKNSKTANVSNLRSK